MTRALVIFESMFGNTEAIARAIGDGLAASMDVDVRDVCQAPAALPDAIDLVVGGGPTHAFSMSRPSTRADAVKQGAAVARPEIGLREWLDRLPTDSHGAPPFATFDTRVDKVRRLPGSAARKAARVARAHGCATLASESFYVTDTAGPLVDGELGRAREWGRRLAAHPRLRVADDVTE
ncbi:MAG: flavodoxin family protein [Nocardioidaceae bacterium]